jgi:hypothetical protein
MKRDSSATRVWQNNWVSVQTPMKQWVKKHRTGASLGDNRGMTPGEAWRKGHTKTKFASVEEERDY